MRLFSLFAGAILSAAVAVPAFSQDTESIKSALKKKFPDAPIDSVRKTSYANIYEVVGAGEIFYTDDKVSYLLVGTLVDANTKENVTEARLRQVNAIKFDTLPFDQAIKIVRGNGSRKIAIFE